jgi:peptidoglycan/xylan/chitin deacetylase (PgdA/CDA1 family)
LDAARQVNICFHGIGAPARELEPGEEAYWITTDAFHRILDLVAGREDVQLTFDDGNASDVEIGLPALLTRGLHAGFYPVAARVGQPGSVDRDGLRALANTSMTVGSHGMWHRPWRGLSDQELTEELVAARRVIAEESGVDVDTAACPLGSYDRRVLRRLRRLGYRAVYTSDRARSRPGAWLQPRFSVRNRDDLESVRAILDRRPDRKARLVATARVTAKRLR